LKVRQCEHVEGETVSKLCRAKRVGILLIIGALFVREFWGTKKEGQSSNSM